MKRPAAIVIVAIILLGSAACLFGGHRALNRLELASFMAIVLNVAGVLLVSAKVALSLRRGGISFREVAVLAGLFTCAFALRWFIPFHTLIHENHHGLSQFSIHTWQPRTYFYGALPSSSMFLQHLFVLMVPLADEGVFLFNAILASAAVPGAYLFARAVFNSALAGWTSAVLLMFMPIAIAMAPTEEFMVTAAGLFFWGGALIVSGVRKGDRCTLLLGVLLVCLASSVRDIALLLAACIPILLVASEGVSYRKDWRFWTGWLAVPAVLLAPRALLMLQVYFIGRIVPSPGLVGFPSVWNEFWLAALFEPFIPMALGLLAQFSLVAIVVHAIKTRQWRPATAVAGCWLVASMVAGIVHGGYFPCHLRHHYLALSLMVLPVGWSFALIAEKAAGGSQLLKKAAFALVPLAGLAMLGLNLDGAIIDIPAVREYRFFREGVSKLDRKAQVIVIERQAPGVDPFTEGWFRAVKPEWNFIGRDAWLKGERGNASFPTYVLLDRTCFTDLACRVSFEYCKPFYTSPFGRITQSCHEILASGGWHPVARLRIDDTDRGTGPGYRDQNPDMPGKDDSFELAILKAD